MHEQETNSCGGDNAGLAAVLRGRTHARYWWHANEGRGYEPDMYRVLSPDERSLLLDWYAATERDGHAGEMAVPMASLVLGMVHGSGIRRLVQLGHFAGYSSLLIGWALRRMGAERGLFSIDLRPKMTGYTQGWLDRAGLGAFVGLHTSDSADPGCVGAAREYLGGAPGAVIIDSSHQYRHTLAELDLWYPALEPGGLLFLHDASPMAAKYDRSGEGGVRRALDEWLARPGAPPALTLLGPEGHGQARAYADPSGLCIIQRR
ncbi:MAG: class I SAM-dependent methyltransferase [Phycisphaerales bacterium]|nr:class I SAM-dependent methyltransferase [Phycisphaerales bacterium]